MSGVPTIPLIDDLLNEPAPPGSIFLVEYDPASQWFGTFATVIAGWMRSGGTAAYVATSQPPVRVRSQLKRLGVDALAEKDGRLGIFDAYTTTLGQKSKEELTISSLKVTDQSLSWLEWMKSGRSVYTLRIWDNISVGTRFNEEKTWVEFLLSRLFPSVPGLTYIGIGGLVTGVLSDWALKSLEAAADGILDIKLQDVGKETKSFMRVRSMRTIPFNSKWYRLDAGKDFEVILKNVERTSANV